MQRVCRGCAEGATLIKFWIIKHSTQTTRSLCLTGPVLYFSFHSASSELPAVVGKPRRYHVRLYLCVSVCASAFIIRTSRKVAGGSSYISSGVRHSLIHKNTHTKTQICSRNLISVSTNKSFHSAEWHVWRLRTIPVPGLRAGCWLNYIPHVVFLNV